MHHFFNTIEATIIFLTILSYIPKEQEQQKALHASPCSVYGCCCYKN